MANGVLEGTHLGRALDRIARQETLGDAVVALVRELDTVASEHALEVGVGNMEQKAGPVAGAGSQPAAPQWASRRRILYAHRDDFVASGTPHVGHEAETTCIALERRVVESAPRW